MDRFERWLKRQRGWRRALLSWIYLTPAITGISFGTWDFFAPGPPTPGGTLLIIGSCSALAAGTFAVAAELFGRRLYAAGRGRWW